MDKNMDENSNDVARQTAYGLAIPTDWSAEEVLFRLANELKNPINSIYGYTRLISELEQKYTDGITAIFGNVERLRSLCDAIRVYLMETSYLPQEKEIMHFLRENVFDPILNSANASSELKQDIISLVRSLNAEADWQMINSWLSMAEYPPGFAVIQKMKDEGFLQFEATLDEFRRRFALNQNRPT